MGTWATDVDFEEMTIEYLLLGYTRGTQETDAYFWGACDSNCVGIQRVMFRS